MKLLVDDMAGQFVQPLRANGYDALFKRDVPDLEWETDDVAILRWARRHRFILWGFDHHRNGTPTGQRMNDEISRRNGRLIQMSGGPAQSVARVLGRLLVHQERWEPFFVEGHGKIRITGGADNAIRLQRPWELPRVLPVRGVQQGADYLQSRDAAHLRGQERRPQQRRDQAGGTLIP